MPALTELLIKSAIRDAIATRAGGKKYDEKGLYLLLEPRGERCGTGWRLKYRRGGVEKLISLGTYPEVTLKRAREKRDEARSRLRDGIDPSAHRQAEKVAQAGGDSFEVVAREFMDGKSRSLAASTWKRDLDQLEQMIFPYLGRKSIREIEAPELLEVLRRIEKRGAHDTAHKARALCGRIWRYGIATGRCSRDIAADLKGALAPKASESYAALIEPAKVGELLRAIDGFQGQPATVAALKIAAYVFVRPGELRAAEWSEFDLDSAEWRIPAERMKMGEQHIVPLAPQVVAILRELQPLTGRGKYVFPAIGNGERPLSENTLGGALRRLGYSSDEMTAHGFRAMASTLLNEQGIHPDLIELQLAHCERNKVRAAYNRAQRLAERRAMMLMWADYLDGLKAGMVVSIPHAA